MSIKSRKVRHLLIVAALLTGGGCSSAQRVDDADVDADVDIDADADHHDADAAADADAHDADADVDSEDQWAELWRDYCTEDWQMLSGYHVEVSEEGVPATPEAICRTSADPLDSNRAATVALNLYSASPDRAMGTITIAPSLAPLVEGTPVIEVLEATPADLERLTLTGPTEAEGGWSFQVVWDEGVWGDEDIHNPLGWGYPSVAFQVTFTIRCEEGGPLRTINDLTYLNLCYDMEGHLPVWRVGGQRCAVCEEMCEMAPSPILPAAVADGTALPRALELEVTPVAQLDGAVALVAEHRGASGPVRYRWSATAGEIDGGSDGGVLWTPPLEPGPHLIQVAVTDRDSAAVASLRWPRPT